LPTTAHGPASCIAARLDLHAPTWRELDPFCFERIARVVHEIESLDPALVPPGTSTVAMLEHRSADLGRAAAGLGELAARVTGLLDHFHAGADRPCGIPDAHRALRLAALSNRRIVSDPLWLHPLGRLRARAALTVLRPLARRQHELLELLTPLFTDRILFIDIDPSTLGALPSARMSAHQRAAITACTRSGALGPPERAELASIPLARSVRRQLRSAELHHAAALGAHYVGDHTMFDMIESSLDVVEEAASLLDADGDLADLEELVDRLVHAAGSRQPVLEDATAVARGLHEWQELAARLSADPGSMLRRGLIEAAVMCEQASRCVEGLRAAVVPVGLAVDGPTTVGELADIAADLADLRDLTGAGDGVIDLARVAAGRVRVSGSA